MFSYPLIGKNSIINYQEFLSSGIWYRPRGRRWTRAWIMVVGGGGGSNQTYVAGGNGCCMMREVILSKDSYTVTIGAGGASGSVGGQTSFGTVAVANGGAIVTNMGLPQNWLTNKSNKPAFCFEYADYGSETYIHYSNWSYTKVVTGTNWFGIGTGNNSGKGGNDSKGAGYSGYCIIFWEEELKTKQRNAGDYDNLKIQEFSSSGTWYRPTRSPATLAHVILKNSASSPYKNAMGTFFLTEDSYTFTTGSSPAFGSIMALTDVASNKITYGANLSASCGMYDDKNSTTIKRLQHWTMEDPAPANTSANSFIMWYE